MLEAAVRPKTAERYKIVAILQLRGSFATHEAKMQHRHLLSCAALLLVLLSTSTAWAVLEESFDSQQPTWQLADADAQVRVVGQARQFHGAREGRGCEWISLNAGQGSYAYLVHHIPHGRVIEELSPTLWVKSDRPGVQLMVRVALPRTKDPNNGGPLTTLVRGDIYRDGGGWQLLAVEQVLDRLVRQTPVLRSQFGPHVDIREAYVDMIVVNAYGGHGQTNVWIDGLRIPGYIARQQPSESNPSQAGRNDDADAQWNNRVKASNVSLLPADKPPLPDAGPTGGVPRGKDVELNGNVLSVDGQPVFLRMWRHQGEPMKWLADHGFNAVILQSAPTRELSAEAKAAGIWLIAPPPPFTRAGKIEGEYPQVLAWRLGENLGFHELENTGALATLIRRVDPAPRPIVCDAHSQLWSYSRQGDILQIEMPAFGGGVDLSQWGEFLRERGRLSRPGAPLWASLHLDAPAANAQAVALTGRQSPPWFAEPRQIRLAMFHALSAGVRGICFESSSPLNANTPGSRLLASALQLANAELDLLQPWIASAELHAGTAASDPQVNVAVLETQRSRLALVVRHGKSQQHTAGAIRANSVAFSEASSSTDSSAYLVQHGRIKPLRNSRSAGGQRVVLREFDDVAVVVFSQNPLVATHLMKSAARQRQATSKLHAEMVAAEFHQVQTIDGQLAAAGKSLPVSTTLIREAKANLQQAERLLRGGDYGSTRYYAGRASAALARLRRAHWEAAASSFPSPSASPLLSRFESLPLHWAMAAAMPRVQWSGNILPGGGMENLQGLLTAGWKNHQHSESLLRSDVALAPAYAHSGENGLRLVAWPEDPGNAPAVVETAPVWITSPAMNVRAGQIIRIHGWVRVQHAVQGSRDGLLVFDSAGGLPLAQRVNGEVGKWKEFTLYRAAPANQALNISLALTGMGEVWLDDLTVEIADRPR